MFDSQTDPRWAQIDRQDGSADGRLWCVVRTTGIALGWIAPTSAFGSVVRKA